VCTSPYSLLDFQRFIADVTSDAQHLSDGHGVDLGRGWVYHATTTLRYGVGAPILGAGVTGMLLLIFRHPRRGLLVALFPVSYYALMGSAYTVFARHMLPVVPFLCLGAAYFIAEGACWLAILLRRPQWSPALVTLGLIGALWPSVHSVVMFDVLMARTDNRLLARRWVEQRFQAARRSRRSDSWEGMSFFMMTLKSGTPRSSSLAKVSGPTLSSSNLRR